MPTTAVPDEGAARLFALRIADDVIRDLAPDPHARLSWRLGIRRADHGPLASIVLDLRPAADAHTAPRSLRIA